MKTITKEQLAALRSERDRLESQLDIIARAEQIMRDSMCDMTAIDKLDEELVDRWSEVCAEFYHGAMERLAYLNGCLNVINKWADWDNDELREFYCECYEEKHRIMSDLCIDEAEA